MELVLKRVLKNHLDNKKVLTVKLIYGYNWNEY